MNEGDGFFLVYSIISRDSYDELETYFELINNLKPTAPFIVFGNKCKLKLKKIIKTAKIKELLTKKKCFKITN